MKHVYFYQNPNWKKWGLAGCLLVALGTNLSFNPESKTIARNDGVSSGAYSLASTTPIPQPEPPAAAKPEVESKEKSVKANGTDEIELKDQYKGLKVKVQYADNKEKARFIIEKHGETQAGICVTCVEKMGPETVTINELDRNNLELTRRAILAAAITQLDKMKPTETKEEKKKEEKLKKIDTSVAATFDFEKYRCDKPDDSEDSEVSVSDFRQCLSDNLKDLRRDCKEAVQEKFEADKSAAAANKQASVKRDSVSCERLTQQFYREEIRPGTRMIKRGQLNSALQTYQLHFNNARIEALRMGLQDHKATEIAQTRAKFAVSQMFPNMVTMEQSNVRGSLYSLHNLMSSYSSNDPQYLLNFQNEYISPMNNIVSAVQSTQNGGINIEQLFRNAMNMDTMLPTGIGTNPHGIYPSGSGPAVIPGRAPIGGGIPRAGIQGVQGMPQQQQYIQQRQQQQYPQQQQFHPQQQIRQGGSLPGLRTGM